MASDLPAHRVHAAGPSALLRMVRICAARCDAVSDPRKSGLLLIALAYHIYSLSVQLTAQLAGSMELDCDFELPSVQYPIRRFPPSIGGQPLKSNKIVLLVVYTLAGIAASAPLLAQQLQKPARRFSPAPYLRG